MRITDRYMSSRVLNDFNRNLEALTRIQHELATARKINKPSDDPLGTNIIIGLDRVVKYAEKYESNINSGQSQLGQADSSMGDIDVLLNNAKQILLSQVDATADAETRRAASYEVDSLIQQVVQVSNHNYRGRYLFAGFRHDTPPFAISGAKVLYTGDDNEYALPVGGYGSVNVNITGRTAFGALETRVAGSVDLDTAVYDGSLGGVATKLRDLNGGRGVPAGSVNINGTIVDLSNAESLEDVKSKIENDVPGITVQVAPSGRGIQLVGFPVAVTEVSQNTVARDLGILGNGNIADTEDIDPMITKFTRLTDLLSGVGIDQGADSGLIIRNGDKSLTISAADMAAMSTVGDLLRKINYSDLGAKASIVDGRNFSVVSNYSGADLTISDNYSTLPSGQVTAYGTTGSALGIVNFDLNTDLSKVAGGNGFTPGIINVAWSGGGPVAVDLSAATTINDVKTAIEAVAPGVLFVNIVNGNAIQVADTGGGANPVISDIAANTADSLGIDGTGALGVLDGQDVKFEYRTENIFGGLIRLRDALLADDTQQIIKAEQVLEDARDTLLQGRAVAGARYTRLEVNKTRLEDEVFNVTELMSDIQDTDYVKASMELMTRQNSFDAALKTAAQTLPMSLINFL